MNGWGGGRVCVCAEGTAGLMFSAVLLAYMEMPEGPLEKCYTPHMNAAPSVLLTKARHLVTEHGGQAASTLN